MTTKIIAHLDEYPILPLTKDLADKFKHQIVEIWNLIPLSKHQPDDILQEGDGEKVYLGKWEHSLIVLDQDQNEVVAFIVGYERPAEANLEYPKPSLHLKSLGVAKKYQQHGIGRKLVDTWLKFNSDIGYKHLPGELQFSTQTNGADFNQHVQRFYESFGFQKTAEKDYPNKHDFIYYKE